jgi:hypothetical protein
VFYGYKVGAALGNPAAVPPLKGYILLVAMNQYFALLLLAMSSTLVACHDTPSENDQPITGDHPAPVDTAVARDTTAMGTGAVPFVNPTKVGRVLGSQSPSPPASRTR